MIGVSPEQIPVKEKETQYIPKIVERVDGTTAEGGW
jgi:hypothetical protein